MKLVGGLLVSVLAIASFDGAYAQVKARAGSAMEVKAVRSLEALSKTRPELAKVATTIRTRNFSAQGLSLMTVPETMAFIRTELGANADKYQADLVKLENTLMNDKSVQPVTLKPTDAGAVVLGLTETAGTGSSCSFGDAIAPVDSSASADNAQVLKVATASFEGLIHSIELAGQEGNGADAWAKSATASVYDMVNSAGQDAALLSGINIISGKMTEILADDMAKAAADGVITADEIASSQTCVVTRAAHAALLGNGQSTASARDTAVNIGESCAANLGGRAASKAELAGCI